MRQTRSSGSEERRQTILLFRWLIVLTSVLLMVYNARGFALTSPAYLLVGFFFASNLGLTFAPRRLFNRSSFVIAVLSLDMALVSAVIYLAGGAALDLFLLYLLIIFAALPSRSTAVSVVVALAACLFHGTMTYVVSGSESLMRPDSLIKIPFLFAVAMFGGLISRQRAELARERDENSRLSHELRRKLVKATESKEKLYEDVLMLYDYNDCILNSLDCGVMVMDLNGTVTAFNRAAGMITGLRCDDVLFSEARNNKALEGFVGLMNKSLDKPARRRVLSIETPSGLRRVIGISTYLLKQKKEKAGGVIAVFADLSDARDVQETPTFSMDEGKAMESFHVCDLIDEVVDSNIVKAEECGATILWTPRFRYPKVSGDMHQIRTVLSSLILNSLQVVGRQGKVCVSTAGTDRGVVVEVVGDSEDNPNEIHSQLSIPFAEKKRDEMDLSPASSAGTSDRSDEMGREGSPDGQWEAGSPAEGVPVCGSKGRANILVADGDNSVRTFYKVILEKAGHNVVLAQDGGEAIRHIFNSPVDLVILEIRMPRVDGMQVIERVSRTHSNLPIIVCTGYTSTQTESLTRSPNVVALLTKPVSIFEFQRTVERALKCRETEDGSLAHASASQGNGLPPE